MSVIRTASLLAVAALCFSAGAQTPAASAAANPHWVSQTVRPALGQIAQTLNGVNLRRWKAPGSVRDAVSGDIDAIQRDLNGTLAGLLEQADANPGSVPAAFAVYRNVNALYDTLLRVSQTGELAAPRDEASALDASLNQLETARESLGAGVQSGTQAQQAEVVRLRAAFAAAAAEARRPVKTMVVNDGPAHSTERSRREAERRRHTAAHHATKTAKKTAKPAATPASTPAPKQQ